MSQPGIKRHQSRVFKREIVIVNMDTPQLARDHTSSISREDLVFTNGEIQLLKGVPDNVIESVGLIKTLFPDAMVIKKERD